MKGNEKDCICEKPNGKHRKNCDAYRLSNFLIKASSMNQINKECKHGAFVIRNEGRYCYTCGVFLPEVAHPTTNIPQGVSEEWGSEVGQILADFENDHDEVKAVNSISNLLKETKAEMVKMCDEMKKTVIEANTKVPLNYDKEIGYNQALSEVISKLKKSE